MNRPPLRPWTRTDPEWSIAHHRESTRTSPATLVRSQLQSTFAELRGAGPARLALGSVGILAILYGVRQILDDQRSSHPMKLVVWLVAAVVIHDGIVAPVTVAIGWALAWVVRGRAQAYVQAALAISVLASIIALPEIYRRGKSAHGQALLERNYALNLGIIAIVVVVILMIVAALNVARSRRGGSAPPDVTAP